MQKSCKNCKKCKILEDSCKKFLICSFFCKKCLSKTSNVSLQGSFRKHARFFWTCKITPFLEDFCKYSLMQATLARFLQDISGGFRYSWGVKTGGVYYFLAASKNSLCFTITSSRFIVYLFLFTQTDFAKLQFIPISNDL